MLLMWPFKAVKLLSLHAVIPCYTHLVSISIGIYTPKQNINIHIVRFSTFSVVLTVLLKQLPSFYNNKTISYQSNIYLQKVCQEKLWVGHPLLICLYIKSTHTHKLGTERILSTHSPYPPLSSSWKWCWSGTWIPSLRPSLPQSTPNKCNSASGIFLRLHIALNLSEIIFLKNRISYGDK